MLLSFDIKFIKLTGNQKHVGLLGKPSHSYTVPGLA